MRQNREPDISQKLKTTKIIKAVGEGACIGDNLQRTVLETAEFSKASMENRRQWKSIFIMKKEYNWQLEFHSQ